MAQLSDIEFTDSPTLPVLPRLKFLHDSLDLSSPARADYLLALGQINATINATKNPTPKNFFEKLCLGDSPREIASFSLLAGMGFVLASGGIGAISLILGLAIFLGGPMAAILLQSKGEKITRNFRAHKNALMQQRQNLHNAECDRLRQQLKARLPEIAAQQKMLAAIHAERDALFTQLNKLGQTAQLLCEGEVSPKALAASAVDTSDEAAAMIAQVAEPIARPAVLPTVNRPARLRTNIGTNNMPQA